MSDKTPWHASPKPFRSFDPIKIVPDSTHNTVHNSMHDTIPDHFDEVQSALCRSEVAMLMMDTDLNIGFATQAARALFGRDAGKSPAAVLASLIGTDHFPGDAQAALQKLEPITREIVTPDGALIVRQISPYRNTRNLVAGLIVTFTDITTQRAAFADHADGGENAAQLGKTLQNSMGVTNHIHSDPDRNHPAAPDMRYSGTIMIVEDDPQVRELLTLFLDEEGYEIETAADAMEALELFDRGIGHPDLLLTDYNLPHGMTGFQLTAKMRERFHVNIPVIILTGDRTAGSVDDIALTNCLQINKPVKLHELDQAIQRFIVSSRPQSQLQPLVRPPADPIDAGASAPPAAGESGSDIKLFENRPEPPTIYIVDDNRLVRDALRATIEEFGGIVKDFPSCEAFLAAYQPSGNACLLTDAYLPGMNGIELLQRINGGEHRLPAIMITGSSDVPMAVQAMKAGAVDFIEKPIGQAELLASISRALEQSQDSSKLSSWRDSAASQLAKLTARQRQIMEMVLAGYPSKNIAADLCISQRTVENHRALVMKKTGSKSLPALARLALTASWTGSIPPP